MRTAPDLQELIDELVWMSDPDAVSEKWRAEGTGTDAAHEYACVLFDDLFIEDLDGTYEIDREAKYLIEQIAWYLNISLGPRDQPINVEQLLSDPNFLIAQKISELLKFPRTR